MLRGILLYLARNKTMYKMVMSVALFRRMALRFVAGERLEEAVAVVQALNAQGIAASLDHLGENVHDAAATEKATTDYIAALDAIAVNKLHSGISVKLTQLGLDISEELTLQNICKVLDRARELGNIYVRIDMEGSDYTERTIKMVQCLREQYGYENVGTVIQSYLYRSEADVEALNAKRIHVRLCKGAYKEGPRVAFPVKAESDANYVHLSHMLLSNGEYPSIATHDPKMISAALDYIGANQIDRSRFEFQMLYGIRRDEQERLSREGYNMRVYVPYGVDWYPYFMRRLAERPANVLFFITGLVKG